MELLAVLGVSLISGTGDSQRDSRESIRANHSQSKPLFFRARQADSHESLEFPIRENHPIRANRANRFARITPLRAPQLGAGDLGGYFGPEKKKISPPSPKEIGPAHFPLPRLLGNPPPSIFYLNRPPWPPPSLFPHPKTGKK